VVDTGTDIVVAGTERPNTRIVLDLGIDNFVAVGVVRAETRLTARLEQHVSEAHRLGVAISDRLAQLHTIYKEVKPDPQFVRDCEALVEVAAKVGIRLSFETITGDFNPDTLRYNVAVRFRGELTTNRIYTVDDRNAEALRDEIAVLRVQQNGQTREAKGTKERLNPGRLEKLMRAGIAENAMRGTEEGAQTLEAWLAYIDAAVDGPLPRQIGVD
jgi:hypothetical protein